MGHLHLIVNHAPIVGLVFCIALAGYGFMIKDDNVKAAALWSYIVLGVATAIAYVSGEPAEELVEHMPGVTDAMVEAHEWAAVIAGIAIGVVALLAGAELASRKKGGQLNQQIMMLIMVISVLALFPMARASYLGGLIRHTEIRPAVMDTGSGEMPRIEAGEESGEEDDKESEGMPEPANR